MAEQICFVTRPYGFFHYEPLFTSFIRLWRDLSAKNLMMPEAQTVVIKPMYYSK
jgi:hypothetical protein